MKMLNGIALNWEANKSALIELGYAFKVAKCFGSDVSVKEIINKLAKAFQCSYTRHIYLQKVPMK